MSTDRREDISAQAGRLLTQWMDDAEVREVPGVDPRAWVASLACHGLWLGRYQDRHRFTIAERHRLHAAIAAYVGVSLGDDLEVEALARALDAAPYSDTRPLVEAVLGLAASGGIQEVTFESVAGRAGKSKSSLAAIFGSVDNLVRDVFVEVTGDGFDDLSALNLQPSAGSVRDILRAAYDARKTVAILRLYVLSGVPTRPEPGVGRELHDLVLRAHREEGAPYSLVIASLAAEEVLFSSLIDSLRGGRGVVPRSVAVEIDSLTRARP